MRATRRAERAAPGDAGRRPPRGKWLELPHWRHIPNGIRHLRRFGLVATASRIFPRMRSYALRVTLYDTLYAPDVPVLRQRIAALRRRPPISVLMPLGERVSPLLRRALASLAAQVYPDWELCLAGTSGALAAAAAILPGARVKQARASGLAGQINAALAAATGDFVLVLHPHDALAPDALYAIAAAVDAEPAADMIYSDEDSIDRRGRRRHPHFKSDWNPDLFIGQDMTGRLTAFRRAVVQQIGGARSGRGDAAEFDLALRAAEIAGPGRIRHIARVLYHRGDRGALPGADGRRRAVSEHFARAGIAVEVTACPQGRLRVRYPLPETPPGVSLIVPTRDQLPLLQRCVEGLLHQTAYPNVEVLIVDNGSVEPNTLAFFEAISAEPRVRVLRYPGRFNYSAINNFAVAHSRNPIIGLINNDIEIIHADWLREMVSHALRPEIGAVGAKLYYPDGRVQHAGTIVGLGGAAGHAFRFFARTDPGYFGRLVLSQNLSAVTAACMVLRRGVFDEVGGFDEANLRVAFNDVDLCLRIRERGYRIVWTPFAELYHWESVSRGSDFTPERFAEFRAEADYLARRWATVIAHDPYYNPNLSIHTEDFALAFPPRVAPPWRSAQSSGQLEPKPPEAAAGDSAASQRR